MSSAASTSAPRSRPSSSKTPSMPKPSVCCHPGDQFLNAPVQSLRCPIDGGVLRDAVKSRVCGHVFGLQCAIFYSLEHECCPVCKASLDASDLQPIESVRQDVGRLRVRCPEGVDRCRWCGPLEEAQRHLNGPSCGVQRVDCPFCDRKGIEIGAAFEQHKEVCEDCVVICPKCCEDMPRRRLNAHMNACTAEIIEPLRRQKENLTQPQAFEAQPLSTRDEAIQSSDGEGSRTTQKQQHQRRPEEEEIDRDPDDDEEEAPTRDVALEHRSHRQDAAHDIRNVSSSAHAPCHLDVTAMGTSSLLHRSGHNASPDPSHPGNAAKAAAQDSDDEFSPAPPPATAPATRDASAEEEEEDFVPCPLAALGCEHTHHSRRAVAHPDFLLQHFTTLAQCFCSLQAAHTSLKVDHDKLTLVVEAQKKTIKMLEVRNALQSGKIGVNGSQQQRSSATSSQQQQKSMIGLVDSPRQQPQQSQESASSTAAATTPATPHVTTDTSTHHDETPKKTVPSSSASNRSVSSPAAPHRVKGEVSFVPSMPKKKPSGVPLATAPRRGAAPPVVAA